MGTLIFYLVLSITFSFLCSILEAVLLSITPTFLSRAKKEGKPYAATLEKLKEDVDKPLIAILTLNTVAHTVGAIGVGAAAVKYFGDQTLTGISIADAIIPALMTLVILVASEIIPKTIGATFWKQLAGFTTRALDIMVKIMKYTGMLWVLQMFTKAFGKKEKSVLSRTDYTIMTEMGRDQGVLKESESVIIQNLLRFNQIKVSEHYTPRNVLKGAQEDQTLKEYYEANKKSLPFSRIPIYAENIDKITGYVLKDEILGHLAENQGNKKLKDIRRETLFVDSDMPLPTLLNKLLEKDSRDKNRHIAIVTNKFGQTEGVITMEDVMETLLGLEIVDELDTTEDMRQLAEDKWAKRSENLNIVKEEVVEKTSNINNIEGIDGDNLT